MLLTNPYSADSLLDRTNLDLKNRKAFCRFSCAALLSTVPSPQLCPDMASVYASGVLLYSSLARYVQFFGQVEDCFRALHVRGEEIVPGRFYWFYFKSLFY